MGTNRRYAASLDRRADERILQQLAASGDLQSLTLKELELDRQPQTFDPSPSKVRAWVRFGDAATRVTAYAVRWTPRAVGVRFRVGERTLQAWVWSSAVEPVPDQSPSTPES